MVATSMWWDYLWRGSIACSSTWDGDLRPNEKCAKAHADLRKLTKKAYFLSDELETTVFAGGAGFCGVVLPESPPRMPSLKLRMPSPIPRITSGMRLPPNKITMTAKTISQ